MFFNKILGTTSNLNKLNIVNNKTDILDISLIELLSYWETTSNKLEKYQNEKDCPGWGPVPL